MAERHRIGKIHAGAWPTCGNKQRMPRAVAQRGDQCFELHAWYGVTALGEQDAPMRERVNVPSWVLVSPGEGSVVRPPVLYFVKMLTLSMKSNKKREK